MNNCRDWYHGIGLSYTSVWKDCNHRLDNQPVALIFSIFSTMVMLAKVKNFFYWTMNRCGPVLDDINDILLISGT